MPATRNGNSVPVGSRFRLRSSLVRFCVLLVGSAVASPLVADDWPTVHHDLERTGRTADSPGPPYEVAWTAAFEGEIITTRCEPIVADGRVFAGTYSGRLRALDAATGRELWVRDLGGPVLHSPAVAGGTVYSSSMAGVDALDAASGAVRWHAAGSPFGYDTSPAVADGLVLLGGRDGVFYAFSAETGGAAWTLATGGPIRTTAAVAGGRVYFASDDMRAYAAELKTGKLLWKSEPLFGQSLRDYYPVLAGGKVILRTNPAVHFADRIAGDTAFLAREAGLPDNHWQTIAAFLKTDRIFAPPDVIAREQEAILRRLGEQPQARSFFLLDQATGREGPLAPVLYVGGCNGVGNPPVVMADGRAMVMYRSAYSNWTDGVAPMVALGLLDPATGRIEPLRHAEGRSPPWGTFWGTADEAQNFTLAGERLLFSHQGTLTGMDLTTRRLFTVAGKRDTWGGLPAVGWTLNEWHGPARGSAAVAGEMLFWITGSRVIAVRGRE